MDRNALSERPFMLSGVDILKALAALLVVAIHWSPFGNQYPKVNFLLVQGVSRVAVPVFFMATGYFYADAIKRKSKRIALINYSYRIIVLYFLWSLLYIPSEILSRNWSSGTEIVKSLVKFGRNLFLCGSYFHLWYFPALISCIIIHHLLSKYLTTKWLVIVATVFYGMSCLGDSYYEASRISPISTVIDIWTMAFGNTRNLFLNGFLFLALGFNLYGARSMREQSRYISLMLSMIFLGLFCIESICLEKFHISRDHNTGLFLVPSAYFLFRTAISWSPKICTAKLRGISVVIFCVHPFVILFTRQLDISPTINYINIVLLSSILGWFLVTRKSPTIKLLY